MRTRVSQEDALLWLNDRLGDVVQIHVTVDCGDYSVTVIHVQGELHHFREVVPEGGLLPPLQREVTRGLYAVGAAASLDIGDSRLPCKFALHRRELAAGVMSDELVIGLGDLSAIFITEPTGEHP
jgi:hypothetical protein